MKQNTSSTDARNICLLFDSAVAALVFVWQSLSKLLAPSQSRLDARTWAARSTESLSPLNLIDESLRIRVHILCGGFPSIAFFVGVFIGKDPGNKGSSGDFGCVWDVF